MMMSIFMSFHLDYNAMYGSFDYSFHYKNDVITVGIERNGEFYRYFRQFTGNKRIEKILLSNSGRIVVNPVEPLNLPQEVTKYLEISFDPIFIEPLGKKEFYLTFPIEIAVFVAAKNDIEVLDIFSLSTPKYSLYGPPNGGVITRWHHSRIFSSIPEIDHNREGILSFSIENGTKEWVQVSRAVFESYGMKIYYGTPEQGKPVSMMTRMRIATKMMADTEFFDKPLLEGMAKSVELHTARDIPTVKRFFTMEWGLV